MSYLNCSRCLVLIVVFRMRSNTVSSICTGALKAALLEAGHVLAQQPCCQSSCPITLGMTFKVGRRRRTKCPYLLCASPAVEPLCSVVDECVCVCCDFGQTWSGIRTAVTSPTCHMRHRGDARGLGIRRHKDGHKEKCLCICVYVCVHAPMCLKE